MLLMQEARMPLYLALAKAGSSSPARMAMIAMTTSNSMRVKAVKSAVRSVSTAP